MSACSTGTTSTMRPKADGVVPVASARALGVQAFEINISQVGRALELAMPGFRPCSMLRSETAGQGGRCTLSQRVAFAAPRRKNPRSRPRHSTRDAIGRGASSKYLLDPFRGTSATRVVDDADSAEGRDKRTDGGEEWNGIARLAARPNLYADRICLPGVKA